MLRLALIGYGHMARTVYCPLLYTLADRVRLTALVEPDDARRAEAQAIYAFESAFETVEQLLVAGVPDVALVLAPAQFHYEIIRALLDAGVDTYTEKPDTHSLAQARELVALATTRRRVYQVGQNRLFMAAVVRAREFLGDTPVDFAHVEKSKSIRRTDAAYLLDDGLHVLSPLLWLAGDVAAVQSAIHVPERLLCAQLRLASGGVATLVQHVDSGYWVERFQLHSSGRSVNVLSPEIVELYENGRGVGEGHVGRMPLLFRTAEQYGWQAAVGHFMDCVQTRAEPRGSARSLLRVHEVMAEIFTQAGIANA